MQYFGTNKITHPLGTKKITQRLWTKRNYATSWGKKNCATSWDKKKITQHLGGKNATTSWDKNIIQPLGTKKRKPSGQKKSCNFSGQNNQGQKNHATSRDKIITLSIGSIASKLVHKAPNFSKWHQICPNGSK